jgi:hypothetical protein
MPRPDIDQLPPNHPARRRHERLAQQEQERGAVLVRQITEYVQEHLDAAARDKGYDSILSACSYVSSTVPKFAAEALVYVALRDAAWSTCYAILADVQSGNRPMPTLQEVIAELPIALQ